MLNCITVDKVKTENAEGYLMNQKTLMIAVVAVVVIAVVVAGVYLATQDGGGGGPSPTATPSPTSTPSGTDVQGASSLQFSVDVTAGGTSQGTYKYSAKNIGTSNMMIRVEVTSTAGNFVYIVNGAQQKAWAYQDNAWTDLSSTYSAQWSAWESTWSGYRSNLASWTGSGDRTYTDPQGNSVRIYSISVNPSLADSLFQPS